MDDGSFFQIALNSYEPSACSPDVSGLTAEGIRITAPARLDLATRRVFPLCGALRLSARTKATLGTEAIEATTLVVVDSQRNRPLSFNLQPDKEPVFDDAARRRAVDPQRFSEQDFRVNHFNVDLLTFSPRLRGQLRPGPFVIYAVLLSHRSNVLQVELYDSTGARP